jgi:hypothetical protein
MMVEPTAVDVYCDGFSFEIVPKGVPKTTSLPPASAAHRREIARHLGVQSLEMYVALNMAAGAA